MTPRNKNWRPEMSRNEITNLEILAAIKDLRATVLAAANDPKANSTDTENSTFRAVLWISTYAILVVAGTVIILESLGLLV